MASEARVRTAGHLGRPARQPVAHCAPGIWRWYIAGDIILKAFRGCVRQRKQSGFRNLKLPIYWL